MAGSKRNRVWRLLLVVFMALAMNISALLPLETIVTSTSHGDTTSPILITRS